MKSHQSQAVAVAAIAMLLLNSCKTQNPRLVAYLYDITQSARNEPDFRKSVDKTCHLIAGEIGSNYLYLPIPVGAQAPTAQDPVRVKGSKDLHSQCNQIAKVPPPEQLGTRACPAFQLFLDAIERGQPDRRVIGIIQIQSNELEQPFCPETLKQLAKIVSQRGGKLAIVKSTNQGGTSFNHQLFALLKNFPNVTFCDQNSQVCILDVFDSLK